MKNIVTVGGGTGSFRVLSGLKTIPDISISAIVSMADDGGSTGKLRQELGVLPPGDIRQCLAALTPDEDMKKFLEYRFSDGHSAGNFFLAGLEKSAGSFDEGLKVAMKVLQIKGNIIPVSTDQAILMASLPDGKTLEGESKISEIDLKIGDVEKIFFKNKVTLNPAARAAIAAADYIIICPGDFYTSIVPNLIAEGFKEAIASSKVKIIAVENLDNKEPENYLKKLEDYLGRPVDNLIKGDKALASDETILPEAGDAIKRSTVRHDPKKLAERINDIMNK